MPDVLVEVRVSWLGTRKPRFLRENGAPIIGANALATGSSHKRRHDEYRAC
jgi:hypothetical protein